MKKKILSLLLAICMVVPMTFSLVACDNNDNSTGTEATQQSSGKESTLGSENITLSYTSTVYDGTEKEPAVTLTYDNEIITSDNYTVSYSNNVNAGTATVVITSNSDSEKLAAGLTLSTTFEIERHPINVSTISQLNAAIQLTDANHVIKLTDNIALERDASNKVVPVLIFPQEKDYNVAIDLNGFDINTGIRIVSDEKINGIKETTSKLAVIDIFNSSSDESVVGAAGNEVDYAVFLKTNNKFDINFENVTFKAYWGGISSNGSYVSETAVSANDCKFIATKADAADGYDAGAGTYLASGKHIYTFEDCTFEGFGGYYTKSGHHTLINCEVKALGNVAFDVKHEKSGGWVTGSAIMIDSSEGYCKVPAAGYQRGLTVDIVGGRFTSISNYGLEEYTTCKSEASRECYAFVYITDGAEFVGSSSLSNDMFVENVDAFVNLGLNYDHNHIYNMSHNSRQHYDECNCGNIINAEDHDWVANEVIIEATFAENGVMRYTCSECGREKVEAYAYATDRTAIYVTSVEELNNAIKTTDENHVIVLANDILESTVTPVVIYPEGRDYNIAIDLAGHDLKSYFRITSKNGGVLTSYNANIYIFNSSNEEAVVGADDDSVFYALQIASGNEFEINLKNVTFKAYWGGLATSGNYVAEAKVNAYGCKFISTKPDATGEDKLGNDEVAGKHAGVGAYLVSAKYIYTFNSCEFVGYSGYYAKNGHHSLINCTVRAVGQIAFAASYNGSGGNATGSALIIDSCENYNKGKADGYETDLTVDVVGGIYSSVSHFAIQEYSTYNIEANRVSYAKVTVSENVVLEVKDSYNQAWNAENTNAVTGLN